MNPTELATFKRVIQTLRFESKTHLTRTDIDRIVQELTMNRDYSLADRIRAMDPAAVSALLR